MVSFNFRIAFLAVTLAGNVAATHIKKHRFLSHRNQCRPRLASTIQPISIFPSAPERSSSVSISAQTSYRASTTTAMIVKHTSTLQPTSTAKAATSLSTSLTHSASASTATTATSTVQPTSTTKVATSLSISLTPNDIKAGIAGGDAYQYMKDHIGWWYDWSVSVPFFPLAKLLTKNFRSPDPSKPGKPIAVPMLWGNGTIDAQDKERLTAFEDLSTVPAYVLGYEEPDCDSGSGSADMSVHDGVSKWESLIAPLGRKGSKLGSPSMCSTLVAVSLQQR
jgi:hypothetical protein